MPKKIQPTCLAAHGPTYSAPTASYPSVEDEIYLRDLWNIIWHGKWIVLATTALFTVSSVVYALSLANIYKSTALLAPSEETKGGGLSALAGQFGGLASLAGITFPGNSDSKIITAIEVIKSRQFAANLIKKYNMLVPLMAVKGWERTANSLIIDDDLYDEESKQWVREVSPPKKLEPSVWEAYKVLSDILTVSQDKATGLISVSVEHYSPYIAQEWTQIIINEINLVMKSKDVSEAQRSIDYLNQQLEKTSVADMKSVFYQLIEEQSKTVMLAEVRDEYVFSIIDPPVVAEEKLKPKRALICFLGALVGCVISVIVVLIRYFLFGGMVKNKTVE